MAFKVIFMANKYDLIQENYIQSDRKFNEDPKADITNHVKGHWRHNDVIYNRRQFYPEMIENMQKRQYLLRRWPQYHFLRVFMVVYIDFYSQLVSRMNIL